MIKFNHITLFFALFALTTFLIGCGGTQTTTTENKTTNTVASNKAPENKTIDNTKPTENKTVDNTKPADGKETASADKTGVPECDRFIENYETCLFDKVPEAQRAAFKPGLDQWKKSWKDLAANPATKSTLLQACKTAAESAKTSMASFSCKWD